MIPKNHTKFIHKRLIQSGNVLEYIEYEHGYFKGVQSVNKNGRKGIMEKDEKATAENREKVLNRARVNVRRLANANSDILTKFFTLTFAENIDDLQYTNSEFNKFVKRVNYYLKKQGLPKMQYICVVEFQKRGAVHYHLLCNLPFVKASELAKLWGFGFIKINKIDSVDNLGAYITKYMTKDNKDDRLIGNRSYFSSQGLKKPIEHTDEETINQIIDNCITVREPYQTTFESDYLGKILYKQFITVHNVLYENQKHKH